MNRGSQNHFHFELYVLGCLVPFNFSFLRELKEVDEVRTDFNAVAASERCIDKVGQIL